MRKANLFVLSLWAALGLMVPPDQAWPFDLETHRVMGQRAAQESGLDRVLKEQLGFGAGIAETFNGTQAEILVANGSRAEDSPFWRVRHHFHNPTRVWNDAGLRVAGAQIGESSVLWSQNPGQAIGGRHSWQDARTSFFQALTAPTDTERQTAYANTFQTVGHLTHLIQDAANPAHSRNDQHLVFIDNDGFHTWAERPENLALISASLSFDPAILGLPSNPLAPIPIARILDTEAYRQTGVPQAALNIGIAEYSNANFFSDDTAFTDFPFPALGSVVLDPPETLPNGKKRRYFRKVRDGEIVNHLAFPSALYDFLPAPLAFLAVGLDDRVFQDYGSLLFPRAVGYSAGLIDYFFRGKIDLVSVPATPGSYVIQNLGNEPMTGTFTLYYDAIDGNRYPVPGVSATETWTNVSIAASDINGPGVSAPLTFTVPTNPIPKTFGEYMLVFRGTLGQEQNAVAGKQVRPAPLVIVGENNAQAFRWTQVGGTENFGRLYSYAYGVSADGSVVVGEVSVGEKNIQAFRWTQAGGMEPIAGVDSYAYGVSADGSVVVGVIEGMDATNKRTYHAFRWTQAGGPEIIGEPYNLANGVSADGSVVAGGVVVGNSAHAYRWTRTGGIEIFEEAGSWAYGISADGSVVVGDTPEGAFRWTRAGGMEILGDAADSAYGVSADGSVVVGEVCGSIGCRAFRWTRADGMEVIGTAGVYSSAYGVSADGSVVVGEIEVSESNIQAFRWTRAGGMKPIGVGDYSVAYGVSGSE